MAELWQDPKTLEQINDLPILGQARLLLSATGFPTYDGTRAVLIGSPAEACDMIRDEASKARRFIFLSLAEISDSLAFLAFMDLLGDKAKEGVEVCVIYEKRAGTPLSDFGAQCANKGLNHAAFTASGLLSGRFKMNRSFIVIDGHAAFFGSLRMTDEWSDNDIDRCMLVRGTAVYSFTGMFLDLWDELRNTSADLSLFRPSINYLEETGFAAPFAADPRSKSSQGDYVLYKMIASASFYVFIQTPTLQMNAALAMALSMAVKSGVEAAVMASKIIEGPLASASDEKSVKALAAEGVQFYEYTSGNICQTMIVSDDKSAYIGSTELNPKALSRDLSAGLCLFAKNQVFDLRDSFIQNREIFE